MFKLFFIGVLIYLLYRVSMTSSLPTPKQKTKANIKENKSKERKIDEDDYIEYEEVD